MYKYAYLKRFHHDYILQIYMYDFMYVDTQTMTAEDYFNATKEFVVNRKKISTTGPVTKHWMEFIYISSEDYELDQNFDDTELKR